MYTQLSSTIELTFPTHLSRNLKSRLVYKNRHTRTFGLIHSSKSPAHLSRAAPEHHGDSRIHSTSPTASAQPQCRRRRLLRIAPWGRHQPEPAPHPKRGRRRNPPRYLFIRWLTMISTIRSRSLHTYIHTYIHTYAPDHARSHLYMPKLVLLFVQL